MVLEVDLDLTANLGNRRLKLYLKISPLRIGMRKWQLEIGYRINRLIDAGGIWRSSLQFSGKDLCIIQLGLPSGSFILPFLVMRA